MAGKPGRGQPNALDKLDSVTRDKCINLLLENRRGALGEVCKLANVSRQAIWEYKKRHLVKAVELASRLAKAETEEFQSASSQLVKTAQLSRDIAGSLPILAVREKRLEALQDRHDRMRVVMEERGKDLESVPGGKSGLLVRQLKQIGGGENAQVVEEYKLDTGLLSEFREHEKQLAMELGQWQEGTSASNLACVVPIQVNVTVNTSSDEAEIGSK